MDGNIVVFDLDDTLAASHRRFEDAILTLLDEAGVSYDPGQVIAHINPMGVPGTVACFAGMGVPGTPAEIYERLMQVQERFYAARVALLPGVQAYLRRLQGAGARLFVLTASPHRLTDPCLKVNGIYDLFERVWCTEEFGHSKGEASLFARVTAAIGCAPGEVLYYDDSVTAIRTARAYGWHTCGVLSPHARETRWMEQTAHTCIHSFEEIV